MRSRLWRHRDFTRFWGAQSVSELGSQITVVALPLAAVGPLHASTFAVAALATLELAPYLCFGLPAGVWVDRLPRRPVLVACDGGRLLLLASVPVAWWMGVLTLAQLFAVAFAAGTLTVFFGVAYQAYLPALLEHGQYVEGAAKLELSRNVSQTAGPAAGGALVGLTSAPAAILGDALSFLASGLLLFSVRTAEPAREGEPRELRRELGDGLRFLRENAIVRAAVVSSGLANLSYGVIWGVLFVYAVRVLHFSPLTIGAVLAVGQVGGVVGALAAGRLAARFGAGFTMIGGMSLVGPGSLLYGVAPRHDAVPLLALGGLIGTFGGVVASVTGVSVRLAVVPARIMGRVIATNRIVVLGVAPLGSLAGGALASAVGLRTAVIAGALIAFGAVVPLLLSPWRSLKELPAPGAELRQPGE